MGACLFADKTQVSSQTAPSEASFRKCSGEVRSAASPVKPERSLKLAQVNVSGAGIGTYALFGPKLRKPEDAVSSELTPLPSFLATSGAF